MVDVLNLRNYVEQKSYHGFIYLARVESGIRLFVACTVYSCGFELCTWTFRASKRTGSVCQATSGNLEVDRRASQERIERIPASSRSPNSTLSTSLFSPTRTNGNPSESGALPTGYGGPLLGFQEYPLTGISYCLMYSYDFLCTMFTPSWCRWTYRITRMTYCTQVGTVSNGKGQLGCMKSCWKSDKRHGNSARPAGPWQSPASSWLQSKEEGQDTWDTKDGRKTSFQGRWPEHHIYHHVSTCQDVGFCLKIRMNYRHPNIFFHRKLTAWKGFLWVPNLDYRTSRHLAVSARVLFTLLLLNIVETTRYRFGAMFSSHHPSLVIDHFGGNLNTIYPLHMKTWSMNIS